MKNSAKQFPPPRNWQDFESVCHHLWREMLDDPGTQKNGRLGSAQHGIDVFGLRQQPAGWVGVQCKGKDNFTNKIVTKRELDLEIAKARGFRPVLREFILATTAPRNADLQAYARKKCEECLNAGLFSVAVWSWEDILDEFDICTVTANNYCSCLENAPSSVPALRHDFVISYAGCDHHYAMWLEDLLDKGSFSVTHRPWTQPAAEHLIRQSVGMARGVIGILTREYDETALRSLWWRSRFATGSGDYDGHYLLTQFESFHPRNIPISPSIIDLELHYRCRNEDRHYLEVELDPGQMLIQAFRSMRTTSYRRPRKQVSRTQTGGSQQ